MEKVQVSEWASKFFSGTADAFRTSVCTAEPNSGKMGIMFAINLDKPSFGPWKIVKDLGFFLCNACWQTGRRRFLTPGWTELWMNPCVDLPSCLLSAFEFLHIPWPGEGPFAVDKPGHHDVFVSRVRAPISGPHSSAVVGCQGVKVTPKPGRPQGLCCLKTETSCVAWWSCCQCSCPTAGHQHIWGFQWAHESSGRRDVIHLHNPALGCALLAAFPTELSYLDPLMKHLLIPYNQELLFGRSLCSLAVLALCLLILKYPYNGPGLFWEKFPIFLPALNRSVSIHTISYSSENAFHWEPACSKVPWHSLSCSFVWSF